MKTFHDYSDLEKANLSEEEVEGLLKYELMEQGIVAPQPPTLLPEDEPELKEKTYYRPSLKPYIGLDCVFATAAEAEAFMALKPLILDSGYPSYRINVEVPTEPKVEIIKAISRSDYESSKRQIEGAAENKKKNKEAQAAYEEKLSAVSASTSHIWTEWSDARSKKRESQQIIDVYAQYLIDCDGNEEIALRFLGKAYSQNEIKDAYAFLEIDCPILDVSETTAEEEVTI